MASSSDGTKLTVAKKKGPIVTSINSGKTWSRGKNAPSIDWVSVASSSDGKKLVAAAVFDPTYHGNMSCLAPNGFIYTSTNSGKTWSHAYGERDRCSNVTSTFWASVASSSDGKKLVAAAPMERSIGSFNGPSGFIYTSTDSGKTWSHTNNAPSADWISVASSSDGKKLVAVTLMGDANPDFAAAIYTSANSGRTWRRSSFKIDNYDYDITFSSVASSSDGSKLVALSRSGPNILLRSTNSGKTWRSAHIPFPDAQWERIASSSDGKKLVAVNSDPGFIITSADSGKTWTRVDAPNIFWVSVASSSDGKKLAAVSDIGPIYTSTNSGKSWKIRLG